MKNLLKVHHKAAFSTMKQFTYLLTGAVLLALASCTSQRYATAPAYEDDDIYYTPGDVYITDLQSTQGDEETEAGDAAADYDYYDPAVADMSDVSINHFYSNGWYPNWNRFYTPGLSLSYMSGWNSPGVISINYNYGFGSPYYYGYSAFGYSPWGPGYDPFWYDPFYSPFYYPTPVCYHPFWSPYGGYSGGYGMPWYTSPYSYYPYYGNNSWNNPWWAGDAWGTSNYHYTPYHAVYTSTANGSSYSGGTVYSANGKTSMKPIARPGSSGSVGDRPATGKDGQMNPAQTDRKGNQQQQTNPAKERERNTRWNPFDVNGENNQPAARPNTGNDRPATRPANGGNTGRTTRPASGRSGGGNSGGTRPSGGKRK